MSLDYCSSRKSPKWTSEDLHRAIELVRSGVPIKPAAEQCNIPVMTLWRRTRALGVVSSRAMTYSLRPQNLHKSSKNNKLSKESIKMNNFNSDNNFCNGDSPVAVDFSLQTDNIEYCIVKEESFEN